MLDEAEIRKEIAKLEYEPSSYLNYGKLATLYIILDRMHRGETPPESKIPELYAYAAPPASVADDPPTVGEYGDSDFLIAVAGKRPEKVWPIIDELMDTLAIVNEKVYNSVMRRINIT